MKGETRRLADLASDPLDAKGVERTTPTTPVVLSGPYGRGALLDHASENVLAIAGGTGISFALPIIQQAIVQAKRNKQGAVELIWCIRKTENVAWIAEELQSLRTELSNGQIDLRIKIFVTRDGEHASSASSVTSKSSGEKKGPSDAITAITSTGSPSWNRLITETEGFSIEWLSDHHPNLNSCILEQWLERGFVNGGRFQVFASGPSGLGRDLRIAVAAKNDAGRVWKGEAGSDVGFYWDDRFS
jgi:ferric-chelate reductase